MSDNNLAATFDYSKVGRKWQQQFIDSAEIVSRLMAQSERPLRRQKPGEDDQAYDDFVQEFYDRKEQFLGKIKEQSQFQASLICHVLSDVPREWLLPDAPEVIDWSDEASLEYIQAKYYAQILSDVQSGEAMKKAKN